MAGRYRIERELGRGARGSVLLAFDEQQQRTVALKRSLHGDSPRKNEHYQAALRREYALLLQLAHPNLVQAYDFGLHDGVPFFTMEHLAGDHPAARGPMSVRAACRMLVGLCQPLSHLHSQGWVHRDLSPHNVKLQPSGAVKLLDLGALATTDAQHRQQGTPAYMAPETLQRERIDARTDLYGLGALGYYALTGQHAYAARALTQLPLLWQSPPRKPSALIPSIPVALDELILSLLTLDIEARPRQLREVVQRLLPFAQLPQTVAGDAAQACLVRPVLVGRDRELSQLRELLSMPKQPRAAVYAVQGARGSGCSRLLDALMLQARALGYAALRIDTRTCEARPYALITELQHAITHLLSDAPLSALVQPSAAPSAFDPGPDPADEVAGQQAFLALCRRALELSPLLLLLDDCDDADQPSLSLLAQLARQSMPQRLAIALSVRTPSERHGEALKQLCRAAWWFRLTPLDAAETERLLITLFGDVPNLSVVARWARRVGGGLPGATVSAANALVAAGAAKFDGGQWRLPERIDPTQPALGPADRAVEATPELSATAAELLSMLSLVTTPPPLEQVRYRKALGVSETDSAMAEGELYAARILIPTGMSYSVRDPNVLHNVCSRMLPQDRRRLELRLSQLYVDHHMLLPAAYHAWRAGDLESAETLLDQDLRESLGDNTSFTTLRFALTKPAASLYEAMYLRRLSLGAAPSELHALRMRLMLTAAICCGDMVNYAPQTLEQLRIDAGLDLWDEVDDQLAPSARYLECKRRATDRYTRTPPERRGAPPEEAIRGIATCVSALSGVYASRCDGAGTRSLVALIEPLAALSPALGVIAQVADIAARSVARGENGENGANMRDARERLVAATAQEVPRLERALRLALHYYSAFHLALDYAAWAEPRALELAAMLEQNRGLAALALQIRRVHALALGHYARAQSLARERDIAALQSPLHTTQLELSELNELLAVARCRDLLEVTRLTARCRERAARAPGWLAHAQLGQVFAFMLADEPAQAAELARQALDALVPFSHSAYQHLACALADAHNQRHDHAEALAVVERLLSDALAQGVTVGELHSAHVLRAVAIAGLGQAEAGLRTLDRLMALHGERHGTNNLSFAQLCEARLQAACWLKDYAGFAAHMELIEPLYANHPSLRARQARWVRAGRDRFGKLIALLENTPARAAWASRLQAELRVSEAADQGDHLLSVLLSEVALDTGQLFSVDAHGHLKLQACRPVPPDPSLLAAAPRCIAAWNDATDLTTADEDGDAGDALHLQDSYQRSHVPLWLTHSLHPERLVGFLLLPCEAAYLGKLSHAFVRALSLQLQTLMPDAR